MGNAKSLSSQKMGSKFLPEEQAEVDRLFDVLSFNKGGSAAGTFSLEALKSHVKEALPPVMVTRLYKGMWRVKAIHKAQGGKRNVSREQFTVFLSHLLKGSFEEKGRMVMKMIVTAEGPVTARDVQKFTEELVTSVVHVLTHRHELRGWTGRKSTVSPNSVQAMAAQLLSEMKFQDGHKFRGPQCLDQVCDQAVIEDWVFHVPHVGLFLSVVIHRGLRLLNSSVDLSPLVPERHVDKGQPFESILDVLPVIYLNSHLATDQQHRWRLLFSTQLHGQSFSQLCSRITHQGPCLVVLEDRDGYVFGGFASRSWEVKPQFQGDNKCFLFSITPSMATYTYTGYNDHFMYLNHGQQTMPNGLGMGGQHHYFGLWVAADFGKGHSKAKPTCTTYNSPQLSAQEDFQFDKMEVWGLGDVLETCLVKNKKSILDSDPAAQSLLEISGRTRHSEGLREVPEEDD
ncbi:TLD domain-containing protein 1 [Microtus ochrogaster]|uniref:MTOR-associated protein MEAK7 n=1 Tax=Microtus ochrogaster TaxID=79684 RepID=A0ABM0KG93_MICOH|nr:TLD domain-containing protein 1 [Microtus ochrogaster]XP_026634678.1 TLD domain-containing protein 1 [Microtus ochrogaster]XP_026634679.1 TLD domain-containing protein 1 [Microtus ochrogaster]